MKLGNHAQRKAAADILRQARATCRDSGMRFDDHAVFYALGLWREECATQDVEVVAQLLGWSPEDASKIATL